MGIITAALTGLAAIRDLVEEFKNLNAWFKKAEEQKWFQASDKTFSDLRKAETVEDKQNAAKGIQDAIKGL